MCKHVKLTCFTVTGNIPWTKANPAASQQKNSNFYIKGVKLHKTLHTLFANPLHLAEADVFLSFYLIFTIYLKYNLLQK